MTEKNLVQKTAVPLPSDQDSSGRTLGPEELALLAEAIKSAMLFSPKGRFVKELEARFAETLGARHAFACSSGTAAVHVAVAAVDPEPGDEIITTPITDMGALAPILYQCAIPVFADVDPTTCNVTAGWKVRVSARLAPVNLAVKVTLPVSRLSRSGGTIKFSVFERTPR